MPLDPATPRRSGEGPRWARLYLRYDRGVPNHPGKRTLLRLLLRVVALLGGRPFPWRMENGALLVISPLEGLAFAWTVGWTCFQTGRWEPHVERCIRQLLRPGDVAVDIGANLGYFTAVMAQSVGASGRVVALEPVPDTFERLQLGAALNGFAQVTALQLALGEADGRAEIAFDPRFAGSASIHRQAGGGAVSREVGVRPLDDLLRELAVEHPSLLKIDVEGHELAVVRGALETIARARPAIIVEYSPELARRGGWTLAQLRDTVSSVVEYRFFELGPEGPIGVERLEDYSFPGDGYGADMLALPVERSATGAGDTT